MVTKVTNFAAEISRETGSGKERASFLQAERDQLSSELAKLKVAAVGREDREATWSNQLQVLQEELANLSKERGCLQITRSTRTTLSWRWRPGWRLPARRPEKTSSTGCSPTWPGSS